MLVDVRVALLALAEAGMACLRLHLGLSAGLAATLLELSPGGGGGVITRAFDGGITGSVLVDGYPRVNPLVTVGLPNVLFEVDGVIIEHGVVASEVVHFGVA